MLGIESHSIGEIRIGKVLFLPALKEDGFIVSIPKKSSDLFMN